MAESCEALDRGEQPEFPPEDILRLVRWKACGLSRRRGLCNYRSCIESERIRDWITLWIRGGPDLLRACRTPNRPKENTK